MAARLATAHVANLLHGRTIRTEFVCDDDFRIAVSFHCFPEEFQGCCLVPLLGRIGFQNLAFVIDRPPQVVRLAADLHKDLVQMPAPLRHLARRF